MLDWTGKQVGKYRLEKLLGQGSFANVYLGQHTDINRQAAIKMLLITSIDKRKLKREAEITARLDHPHIVRLWDCDFEQETPYLVFDYAPGGSFYNRHQRGSIIPLTAVMDYLNQISSALQYAHDQQIIHLDIKPSNVLIGRRDELLVSDFGIARFVDAGRTTLSSAIGLGTAHYMAPEQFLEKPVKASDQYALAAMVYEWLCGSVPFVEENFFALFHKHRSSSVPPLREKNQAIPPQVEAVIMKALSKEPNDRFESVMAFAKAFDQATKVATQPAQVSMSIPSGRLLFAYRGHSSPVKSIAWSPAGGRIVSEEKDVLHVWEASNGTTIYTYRGHVQYGYNLAWSPDSTLIASAEEDGVHVLNARNGAATYIYHGHSGAVCKFAWSPDSTSIASGYYDDDGIEIHIWDANHGRNPYTREGFHDESELQEWSPDLKRILVQSTRMPWAAVYDIHSKQILFSLDGIGNYSRYTWSPDGKRIVSMRTFPFVGNGMLWDTNDGRKISTYTSPTDSLPVWSLDGKRFSSIEENRVYVWDASNGATIYTYRGHSGAVGPFAWSPDGKHIASGDKGEIHVWDASNGTTICTYRGHSSPVSLLAWSPNGKRIASVGEDGVHVWQVAV